MIFQEFDIESALKCRTTFKMLEYFIFYHKCKNLDFFCSTFKLDYDQSIYYLKKV